MTQRHRHDRSLEDQSADTMVRKDSDTLLTELERLRQLETETRGTGPTTPEFHDLAGRVTQQSRVVLETAAVEEVDGQQLRKAEEREGRTH